MILKPDADGRVYLTFDADIRLDGPSARYAASTVVMVFDEATLRALARRRSVGKAAA